MTREHVLKLVPAVVDIMGFAYEWFTSEGAKKTLPVWSEHNGSVIDLAWLAECTIRFEINREDADNIFVECHGLFESQSVVIATIYGKQVQDFLQYVGYKERANDI